jgi:putative membrane protein
MTKQMLLPLAAVALLTMCSPRNNNRDTAALGGDTTATGAARADSSGMAAPAASTANSTSTASNEKMDDSQILAKLAMANSTEIQQAEAAEKKATSPAVKAYAQMLVRDHTKGKKQGDSVAKKIGAQPSGSEMSNAAESKGDEMTALENKSGHDYDKAFISHEIDDHQKDIDELKNDMLPKAQSPEVKALIEKTLPVMQQHLEKAKQIEKQLG